MSRLLLLLLAALAGSAAHAQTPPLDPPPTRYPVESLGARRLSGPRLGATWLSARTVRSINETLGDCDYDPRTYECQREPVIGAGFPVVTQFGWQWERQLFRLERGTTGLFEAVVLVGGAERGVLLPSATALVGMRTVGGLELGVGPNVSGTSVGYALTVGHATDLGDVVLPVNGALVLGPDGPRLSLLVGAVVTDRRY